MDRMVERANRCYRWHDMVASTSVRGERRGCESMLQESTRAAKLGKRERAKKGGKEMARPYTKLAPATKTGHQDAIALARSRNDSKGRRDTSGRSRDEVWRELGDVRSQDT
jgi:hypothetical protein